MAEAAAAVSASSVDGGRLQVRASDTGAVILDDRYNSSPALAGRGLAAPRGLEAAAPIALLGPMAELGEHEEDEHRRAGKLAAAACDLLVAVGEPCRVLVERRPRSRDSPTPTGSRTRDEAAAFVRGAPHHRATPCLLKASRGQALETIIPLLEGAA